MAFVIMSLTLGVLFQIFGTGLRTSGIADAYAQAGMLAQSQLALAADTPPLREGQEQGAFEGTPFRWEQTIVAVEPAAFGLSPLEGFLTLAVTVRVHWPAGRADRELTLRTLRLQRAEP